MRVRRGAVVLIAALALVAASCNDQHDDGARRARTRNVTVDEKASGATVSLHVGDHLTVVLHSTYWQINAPDPRAAGLVIAGPQRTRAAHCGHIPGAGCGTATREFRADRRGVATVSAHRDSCGEALRCTGTQSDWKVTAAITESPERSR